MAMFLTGKLIDRQDFIRNLLTTLIFAVIGLDYSFILKILLLQSCSVAISV